jgi:hypothetical protein
MQAIKLEPTGFKIPKIDLKENDLVELVINGDTVIGFKALEDYASVALYVKGYIEEAKVVR